MIEDDSADAFVSHRALLFTVAYEFLGSAADAEDVVQDTWLRWAGADTKTVRNPRAYLVKTAARLALNRLRTLARRKEDYVGRWLPEPVSTAPDAAERVELASRVSLAKMVVLESLGPTERAVFVLREVFSFGYDEIADIVDKSNAATRRIASRARRHVAERRPHSEASPEEARAAVASFERAVATGDLQGLLDVLAPSVVLVADGGGVARAALRPIVDAGPVARYMLGALGKATVVVRATPITVNATPGLRISVDGRADAVIGFDVVDGRIAGIFVVRNPEKLTHVGAATAFSFA